MKEEKRKEKSLQKTPINNALLQWLVATGEKISDFTLTDPHL